MVEHTSATTIGGFCSQPERCNNAGSERDEEDENTEHGAAEFALSRAVSQVGNPSPCWYEKDS